MSLGREFFFRVCGVPGDLTKEERALNNRLRKNDEETDGWITRGERAHRTRRKKAAKRQKIRRVKGGRHHGYAKGGLNG